MLNSDPNPSGGVRHHSDATPRALVIGGIGSAVLTASSMYIALKLGALPWPIVFAALASVVVLRLMGGGDIHEANVAHTAMSAGSMVAGGLAFTIPGIWILDPHASVPLEQVLAVSLAGTALGLIATAVMRPHFIDRERLPFPIGISAAETLVASTDTASRTGRTLFASMGLSALFAIARDTAHLVPQILLRSTTAIPGAVLGISASPMSFAVGFIVGPVAAGVWFVGALAGVVGILGVGVGTGLLDLADAEAIRSSLGLGLMLGVGLGVVALNLAPLLFGMHARRTAVCSDDGATESTHPRVFADGRADHYTISSGLRVRWAAIACAAIACGLAFALDLGALPSVLLIAGTWLAVFLSSYLTGTSGVNPMEIFGVMLLLLVRALSAEVPIISLFLLAAAVAVATGICGDVMNDFRAGQIVGTAQRDQIVAQIVGGLIGAIVAVLVLFGLVEAYGTDAFGAGRTFVAAQASVVATMAGGIPCMPAFIAGAVAGLVLGLARLPVMTLGLGVYLPFYLSAATALGAAIRFAFDRNRGRSAHDDALRQHATACASGILGGESLIGVITALVIMIGAALSAR